ncbi:MAG: hypothetical protein AABM42_08925 [Actinomycetota bacterium]
MASPDSPYPLGTPVNDPRLLQNRRSEIATALEAVAPAEGTETRHTVLLGEQRSGRSTVLLEVARRAAAERGRLVVWLRGADEIPCNRQGLTRHLLTATAEALAHAADATTAPWYLAWRDRVYLRDHAPSTERDLLSSALVLSAAPEAEIDRAILERDLAVLLEIAREAALRGIAICIDDASSLTEDVALVEELLSTFDAVGGYSLLMAGLPATAGHFVQAASPCLARLLPVWLRPFRGPHQIFTSLSAPLTGPARDWLQADDAAFLRDVLLLTGGNPYELMLVGHHLWLTCQRGEQDGYVLTPRVLERVIPSLSLLASGGDALLDGADAIDRLAEEHVRQAVELVALSRLTIREIAIARILKIDSRDTGQVDRAILRADIGEECERVLAELEELQEAGVIQLHADGQHFSVVGGRPASVLLKYKARARIGAEVSSQPFEQDFLAAVGHALVRDATLRTLEALEGSASLGFSAIMSEEGAGRLSPRPAVRSLGASGGIGRLVQAEIDLIPLGVEQYKRIAELLTEPDPAVALVYTGITHEREQFEYTELWEVAPGVEQEDLARAWSTITEEWEPVVAAAELTWSGSEFAVLRGETARQALIVLQRYAAVSAVLLLFKRWREDRDEQVLARAQRIGEEAVATMRATGLSEWELGGELSEMLSRVGFLKSFDDALLDEARTALEEGLRTGAADTWVTNWNLANVAARQGDTAVAMTELDNVAESVTDWSGSAFVLFFLPDRDPADCLITVTDAGIEALLELQRAVVAVAAGDDSNLAEMVDRCRASDDPGAAQAAKWATKSLATTR